MRNWFHINDGNRPELIRFELTRNMEVSGILVKNSPYYHIVINDCENAYMHDMEIYVDVWG